MGRGVSYKECDGPPAAPEDRVQKGLDVGLRGLQQQLVCPGGAVQPSPAGCIQERPNSVPPVGWGETGSETLTRTGRNTAQRAAIHGDFLAGAAACVGVTDTEHTESH